MIEDTVDEGIKVGTVVQLVRSNGKKYSKARFRHLVGSAPGHADLWLDRFEPMKIIHESVPEDMIQPKNDGEYRLFGFQMRGITWYHKVWIVQGNYYMNFPFTEPVRMEVVT